MQVEDLLHVRTALKFLYLNVFLAQNIGVFSHKMSFASKYPEHELGEVRASCY